MKNIGLFGGTFDPVHNGHLHIARAFADETGLDTVVFLPAGDPYHKPQATQTSAAHRLAMTELAAAEDTRFAVSDCDIVRGGATYTFDTVQIFRQQFPAARLWWLLGSDSLGQTPRELHAWLGEALQNGSVRILQAPLYDISSTRIRQDIRNGSLPDGLIPPQVARYIREHGLYR